MLPRPRFVRTLSPGCRRSEQAFLFGKKAVNPVSHSTADTDELRLAGEERTTPLELFFDLVFVFGITQVTKVVTLAPTAAGFARAAVLLGALWYAWICFAWLTNNVDVEEGVQHIGILLAGGASFLVALAVPRALSDQVWLFVSAYFVVRLLHVTLYAYGLRDEPDARRTLLGFAPTFILGPAALFALPFVAHDWRIVFLLAALAFDISGPYLSGVSGLRVRAGHFAERFSLFMIITLGEAIVAVGVGAESRRLTGVVVAAAALAFGLSVLLWWAYFDVVALAAEERLNRAGLEERARLARDAFTYLHYLLIAGIVGFAYGCKKLVTLTTEPLTSAGAIAFCGGVALYLIGHAVFRLRMTHSYGLHHLGGAAAALIVLSFATHIPALATGVALALILLSVLAWERHELGSMRRRLRARRS